MAVIVPMYQLAIQVNGDAEAIMIKRLLAANPVCPVQVSAVVDPHKLQTSRLMVTLDIIADHGDTSALNNWLVGALKPNLEVLQSIAG